MLALLTGTVSGVSRTFQVQDQNSGYMAGIPNNRNYTLNNIAAYMQDSWRLKPNFTVRAGLKWEYYSPVKEDDNLGFLPVLNGKSYEEVLRDPNATISFVNGGMWNSNKLQSRPDGGFAWDVFKDGRTSVRGGYSLTYVNEEGVTVATASLGNNAGLATGATLSNLYPSTCRCAEHSDPDVQVREDAGGSDGAQRHRGNGDRRPEHQAAQGAPGECRHLT